MSRKPSEQKNHPATILTSNQATLLRSAISLEAVERDRLAQILDDYLSAIERGASITSERLLAENPADAEKLRLYLQGLEMLNVAVQAESILIPGQATVDTLAEHSVQSTAGSRTGGKRRSLISSIGTRSLPRLLLGEGDATAENPFTALRHSRVRAAALCCTIWWSTIVVVPLVTARLWAWVPACVTLVLAGIFGWLTVQPRIGARLLRCIEILLFGTMAAGFAIITYTFQSEGAAQNDAVAIALATKNADIAAMTLLFPYAMLIPNSWQRALPMISILALYPFAVTVFFMTKHPEALSLTASHTLFDEGGLNLFKMLIAGSLALYGVHVLDTLRIEAFEVRRLNQYHVGERIGEGGMGEVYLAEHRLLKRPCAIKLIRSGAANNPDALRRFEREVRSTARLSHPNIIQIFDYGHTDDATFYYVMEYLHGMSLADLVERHGPQPPGRVIYILSQACLGLAEAHAAGLLHRDVKPANILVAIIGNRYDVAKVLDFGLVKELTVSDANRARPEGIAGTPLYMAPEQAAEDEQVDRRADLYALGGVAFYLLTGKPPFERDTFLGTLMAHATQPAVAPSSLNSMIPTDLDAVVLRCLAKLPADRYADSMALYRAFQSCESAQEWDSDRAAEWWGDLASAAAENSKNLKNA